MPRRIWSAFVAVFAVAALAGCASTISPGRQDFVIVEGRLGLQDWDCGTVSRPSGGYYYVCDMPLEVRRVVLGQHPKSTIMARYFFLELEREDEIITGPHIREDRRGAAILWRGGDGPRSYILMDFPGRWCVPGWMTTELIISAEETMRLQRAGYPLCS